MKTAKAMGAGTMAAYCGILAADASELKAVCGTEPTHRQRTALKATNAGNSLGEAGGRVTSVVFLVRLKVESIV